MQAFYDAAAGRVDILGQYDAVYRPDRLEIGGQDDDRIIIGVENQGLWKILIGRDDPNPTVYYSGADGDPCIAERDSSAPICCCSRSRRRRSPRR